MREALFELGERAGIDDLEIQCERTQRSLGLAKLKCAADIVWVVDDADASARGRHFAHQLDDLGAEIARQIADAGDVTAGPRQAGDHPKTTGSATPTRTMGSVLVARRAARTTGVVHARITSTLLRTSSAAAGS